MFGFLKRQKKEVTPPPASPRDYRPAPRTAIRYSPELIDNLKSDHKDLLALYTAIKADFEQQEYTKVVEKLADLRTALTSHLLTENVRLYVYLDRQFSTDEINSELIRSFRREIDGISRIAMNFLEKYEELGVDADLAARFSEELATISKVLSKRIAKEEQVLYALYLPEY